VTDYTVEIDGDEFQPIPESWLDHPSAVDGREGEGPPRIYAVSAARLSSRCLKIRYAQPKTNNVLQFTTGAAPGPEGDGYVPAQLREPGETWQRSMVPVSRPMDVLRVEEIAHFRELWADRVDAVPTDGELVRGVIPDGGRLFGGDSP